MEERKIIIADPTALGLFGLAMVTLVASSSKLGWTSGTSLVIPWAIFLGAGAQLVASLADAKKNNAFGATAFGAYAFFWFAVGMSWMIQGGVFGSKLAESADGKQLAVAFVGYLIFTLYMTIASTSTTKVLFAIFVLIDFLFIGLALTGFGIAPEFSHKLAGWSELGISLLSFYGSAGAILNHHFNRVIVPLGKPLNIITKG
ncbi:MAG: acetate uptake transporter [Eubacteriales bacterium]|nr:acetate uptake transporter [Eubacteriales bacterium]